MLRRLVGSGVSALAFVATAHVALGQQLSPERRQGILDEVTTLTAAERADFLDTRIPRWVSSLSNQMPLRVDELTTATGITFDGAAIEFTYATDSRVGFAPELMAQRHAVLAQAFCSQDEVFWMLAVGVTLRFVYRVDKATMGALEVEVADCLAAAPAK